MKSRKAHSLLMLTAAGVTGSALAAPPAGSPYFTDPQSSYVQDATTDSIGSVNMIACIMHAMRPDAMVTQSSSPYIALIDKNQCDSSKQASTSNSAGSGTQAPDYMTAIVDSTRASNSDPMIVKAWISINENNTPVTVWAHISATAAPSASNPYGVFRLDYCGLPSGLSSCAMQGFMEAKADGTLSYYEQDDNGGGQSQTTALQLSSVGTASGSGSLSFQQTGGGGGGQNAAFDFAYNGTNYLRSDNGSTQLCFSRDASDPATGFSVWSYGLYDSSTGARVDLNSGFPMQYTSGATTYQGFIGYYGLSVQGGAPAPTDGMTVQKVDYSNNSSSTTPYTLVENGGRLVRYTRQTKTLQQIDQIPFMTWINQVGTSGLPDAQTQYVFHWDDAASMFIATGEMQCGGNGCNTANLASPVSVDPSFFASLGGVHGSSQSLGGDLFVDLSGLSGSINSASTTVVYHVQDIVYPDDANKPATLYCISNCPSAASLSAYFTQSGTAVASPYLTSTFNQYQPVAAGALVTYTVDGRAQLTDGAAAAVVYTDANAYAQYPQYQNGVMSGRLFVNQADAACNGGQFCDYAVNSATVYYQWQTGSNTWDQFAAVKDSNGNYVHFDAPLQVNFTVPANAAGTSAPYGNYAGTSMVLQYGGYGDLWGVPGSCYSATDNSPVACNTAGARYVSDFAIPYDPTDTPVQGAVTYNNGTSTVTYLVKWLNREIRFAKKPLSACSGLSTASATLPTAAGLNNPTDSTSSVYLGTEPTLSGNPSVIQGVVEIPRS